MPAPIVFFDIAGPDADCQRAFYEHVLGWAVGPGGALRVAVQPELEGVLRADPADKMLYFGVEDIAATLVAVEAHGGKVDVPRFEVPGRVILGLFFDPAGNRLGLVEMDGDSAKVP